MMSQLRSTRPVLKSVLVNSRRAKPTEVAAALQVWSNTFSKSFDSSPEKVQITVRAAFSHSADGIRLSDLGRF